MWTRLKEKANVALGPLVAAAFDDSDDVGDGPPGDAELAAAMQQQEEEEEADKNPFMATSTDFGDDGGGKDGEVNVRAFRRGLDYDDEDGSPGNFKDSEGSQPFPGSRQVNLEDKEVHLLVNRPVPGTALHPHSPREEGQVDTNITPRILN